jgi:hypothetical protein
MIRRLDPWFATCTTMIIVALSACDETTAPAPTMPSPNADVVTSDIVASAAPSSIPNISEYSWSQGQAPTYMGSNSARYGLERVCYLTRLSGKFTGPTEELRVYLVGSSWYLGGSSSSSGIGGRARCMTVSDYGSEDMWWEGLNPIVMNKGSNWMCFLTGLAGELAGTTTTNMDWVKVDFSGGGWTLRGGGKAGKSSWIRMRARCATPLDGDASVIGGGSWWMSGWSPTNLGSTTGKVCVFVHVFGAFQSSTSHVKIQAVNNAWYLSGGSLGANAGAGAKCYYT